MLRRLFEEQRIALDRFFRSIDVAQAEAVFDCLRSCAGVIILSGVGKSGHIAQKIAATFNSTGTRASFLSPAHALHGDIGFVSPQDVFLFLSKSGESQELLDLLPHIQKKGAFSIAAVSQGDSRLAKAANLSILLPIEKELCPFDLAPTTSTAAQLLFGDCLAIALMQAKGFTIADFAANHPAGLLGRKITLRVSDLMLKGGAVPLCRPSARLIDALHELTAKRCGCLLVCDEERRLQGIFTDGDLRRAIQGNGPEALQISLSRLMTSTPLTTEPSRLALEALRQMEANPARLITVLPVLEQGQVVGLLRLHDIVQAGLK
jgi:arabinose-5-phosphate isomerase